MGGKGGCGLARSSDGARDKSSIDRIMLRFRPIAPKPASDGSPSDKSTSESNKKNLVNGKAKRKYVRVRKNKQCKRKKTLPAGENGKNGQDETAATLQLLPERSDGENLSAGGLLYNLDCTESTQTFEDPHVWLNSENSMSTHMAALGESESTTALIKAPRVIESWVTVECVTDTCMDGGGLWLTDEDRVKNLEVDRCPGFISDGFNLVQWVNEAYEKMVSQEDDDGRGGRWQQEFKVWLVMKERLPYCHNYLYPAFACRARVEYPRQDRQYSRVLPCDVWRMDCGGFAWRLDVESALSLGI